MPENMGNGLMDQMPEPEQMYQQKQPVNFYQQQQEDED